MNQIREVNIVTGNVLNKTLTIRKGTDATAEELYQTLSSCLENPPKGIDTGTGNSIEVNNNEDNSNGIGTVGEDRSELKVTLKLFLYDVQPEDINQAIARGLEQSSVDFLDTLVLSFPGQDRQSRLTLDIIQKTWMVLEDNVAKNRVKMIGICDLDSQLFLQLYNWAKVKPSIVQINLSSCCVVPPELSSFCKENGVQLLTHSDPMEILGQDKLEELMKPLEVHLKGESTDRQRFKWEAKWIIRYQIHLKSRGVLASKGYVASFLFI